MQAPLSLMVADANSAPHHVAKQLETNGSLINEFVDYLRKKKLRSILTLARGSSDYAATYAKYLFETQLGLLTTSLSPSVYSIYHSRLDLKNTLVIAISQSGQSVDLCESIEEAKKDGAITLALVNQMNSPLAALSDFCFPLSMGEEKAVAATKSYIGSVSALLQLTAIYQKNKSLIEALDQLPLYLEQAANCAWPSFQKNYFSAKHTLICGRGIGFSIAQESALKFKETCQIQAEAFSAAEVLHGPFAIIEAHYPVLIYAQNDESLAGTLALAEKVQELQGNVLLSLAANVSVKNNQIERLTLPKSLHSLCDPLIALQAFYLAIASLAVSKNCNPDNPPHLKKITITR